MTAGDGDENSLCRSRGDGGCSRVDYSVSSRCDPQVAGELATTVCSSVILSHTTLKGHTKISNKRDGVINTHNYKSHKTAFDYTAMEITAKTDE